MEKSPRSEESVVKRDSRVLKFYEEVSFRDKRRMGQQVREVLLTYTSGRLELSRMKLEKVGIVFKSGIMVISKETGPKPRIGIGRLRTPVMRGEGIAITPRNSPSPRGVACLRTARSGSGHFAYTGGTVRGSWSQYTQHYYDQIEAPSRSPYKYILGKTSVAQKKLQRSKQQLHSNHPEKEEHKTDGHKRYIPCHSSGSTDSNRSKCSLRIDFSPDMKSDKRSEIRMALMFLHSYAEYFKTLREEDPKKNLKKSKYLESSFSPSYRPNRHPGHNANSPPKSGDGSLKKRGRQRHYSENTAVKNINDFALTLRMMQPSLTGNFRTKSSSKAEEWRYCEENIREFGEVKDIVGMGEKELGKWGSMAGGDSYTEDNSGITRGEERKEEKAGIPANTHTNTNTKTKNMIYSSEEEDSDSDTDSDSPIGRKSNKKQYKFGMDIHIDEEENESESDPTTGPQPPVNNPNNLSPKMPYVRTKVKSIAYDHIPPMYSPIRKRPPIPAKDLLHPASRKHNIIYNSPTSLLRKRRNSCVNLRFFSFEFMKDMESLANSKH